jgi:hypothetical protein
VDVPSALSLTPHRENKKNYRSINFLVNCFFPYFLHSFLLSSSLLPPFILSLHSFLFPKKHELISEWKKLHNEKLRVCSIHLLFMVWLAQQNQRDVMWSSGIGERKLWASRYNREIAFPWMKGKIRWTEDGRDNEDCYITDNYVMIKKKNNS